MKVKKHLQIDAIMNSTGRLPSDMENLEVYHQSSSTGEPINVGEMDLTYLIRAFAKCQTSLVDNSPTEQYHNLHGKIAKLEELIEEKEELLEKEILQKDTWRNAYYDECSTKGNRYVFEEIPNNEYGKKLTRGMKVYLNDESYTMRVRGQHIKPELRGTGATYWGQSIEESTHLRVYIDKKRTQ